MDGNDDDGDVDSSENAVVSTTPIIAWHIEDPIADDSVMEVPFERTMSMIGLLCCSHGTTMILPTGASGEL